MHVLIVNIGEKTEAIATTHAQGFSLHAGELKSRLGITSEQIEIPHPRNLQRAVQEHPAGLVIVQPTWRHSAEDVIAGFRSVYEQPTRPHLVFLDWYAPTSSPHFGVLPYLDRYLKRTVMVDFEEYRKPYVGGYAVADFVCGMLGLDLGNWKFGSEIPAGHEHKLWMGWNFGIGSTYHKLVKFASVFGKSWSRRTVDVNRRLGPPAKSLAPNEWYQNYRDAALKSMEPLVGKWRCSDYQRVPRRKYIFELLNSKMVFSPFGWGEVCFRDYEAVCCGALLVKPSMKHVVTSPNIYVDYETYIPVKWDLSDAASVIEYYLNNPEKASQIAKNAQEVLRDYYKRERFVDDVQRSLRGLLTPA
jgi:hypothetical protein